MAGFTQPGNARMEPEIIIVVLATFVGGGAMGATGMLLCQWVVRKMSPPPQQRLDLMDPRDVEAMKADVADLAVRLHSVDARLDFTEQLLGGALSGARPPNPFLRRKLLRRRAGLEWTLKPGRTGRTIRRTRRTLRRAEETLTRSDRARFVHDGHDVSLGVVERGDGQLVAVGPMYHLRCLNKIHAVTEERLIGRLDVSRPKVQQRRE